MTERRGRQTGLSGEVSISSAASDTGYCAKWDSSTKCLKLPRIQAYVRIHMQQHGDAHVYKSCGHTVQRSRLNNEIHTFFFTRVRLPPFFFLTFFFFFFLKTTRQARLKNATKHQTYVQVRVSFQNDIFTK